MHKEKGHVADEPTIDNDTDTTLLGLLDACFDAIDQIGTTRANITAYVMQKMQVSVGNIHAMLFVVNKQPPKKPPFSFYQIHRIRCTHHALEASIFSQGLKHTHTCTKSNVILLVQWSFFLMLISSRSFFFFCSLYQKYKQDCRKHRR